jgi:hypothetical protein
MYIKSRRVTAAGFLLVLLGIEQRTLDSENFIETLEVLTR